MRVVHMAIIVLAMAASACHTVKSYHYNAATQRDGVVYALPISLVQAHAWAGKDDKRLKEIATETTKIDKALKTAKSSVSQAKEKIGKEKDKEKLKKLEGELEAAEKSVTELDEKKAKLARDKTEAEKPSHRLTLEVLPAVADPDHIYVAENLHTWLRRDVVGITLTSEDKSTTNPPLMKEVAITADDRTGEVLLNIAKAYFSWSTGIPTSMPTEQEVMNMLGSEDPRRCTPEQLATPYDILTVFNPTELASVETARSALTPRCYSLRILDTKGVDLRERSASSESGKATPTDTMPCSNGPKTASPEASPGAHCGGGLGNRGFGGIVYHQANSYVLDVSNPYFALHRAIPLAIPNEGPIGVLPFKAGMFVETTHTARFEDGSLVKSDSTRPSELEAFSLLPLRLFEELSGAATDAVADVVQLKVDTTGDAAAAADAAAKEAAAKTAATGAAQ